MSQDFAPDTPLPCRVYPSPNHGDRRGRTVRHIVLHYTGMPSVAAARAWLCDPASEVSSHYLIDEKGGIEQLVPEARRAWHAGRSFWRGERDLNSTSVGIEIANAGHDGGLPPFPEAQIAVVIALCRDVMARWKIKARNVLAHSDIAPDRKIDPGERFPWMRLAQEGVGVWPECEHVPNGPVLGAGSCGHRISALQEALGSWGYELSPTSLFDMPTQRAIASFQRRFRPERVDGTADADTMARLRALLKSEAWPCT